MLKIDRTKWTPGWIAEDPKNDLLICVTQDGTVVGTCDTRRSPEVVKRWIIKVGEFKGVDIRNKEKYIDVWNERMVNDDDDKYIR